MTIPTRSCAAAMAVALLLALPAHAEPQVVPPEVLWSEAKQRWDTGADALATAPGFWARGLSAIGFSKKGAFAWLDGGLNSESDCPHAAIVVQDLASDRRLASLALIGAECPHPDAYGGVKTDADIAALLARHGIEGRPIATLAPKVDPLPTRPLTGVVDGSIGLPDPLIPFPLVRVGEDGIAAELRQRPRKAGDTEWPGYGAPEAVVEVTLRSTRLGAKVLGTVPAAGDPVLTGPAVRGAFISPWEPRIAVVVAWYSWGLESPAGRLDYAILGARLDRGFAQAPK